MTMQNQVTQAHSGWTAPVLTTTPQPRQPRRVSGKAIAFTAAIAAAATTAGIVYFTGGHDDTATFCRDYQSLSSVTSDGLGVSSMSVARSMPDRFRKLAAEGPVTARADLLLLATDMSTLVRTGTGSISDDDAQAAADRVDAVAEKTCNS